MATGSADDPNKVYCCEDLVNALRDEEVMESGLLRQIYVTSKRMGSEGSTGRMEQGDLAADLDAKIIFYDKVEKAFTVSRNGNPPREDELVPDEDIGALLRSFVRDMVVPAYVTMTDTDLRRGVETIRMVIPARQIEMRGPHRLKVHGGEDGQGDSEGGGLSNAVIYVLVALLVLAVVALVIYWKFFRKDKGRPPENLPDMRPYVIAKRHGTRNLLKEGVSRALNDLRP